MVLYSNGYGVIESPPAGSVGGSVAPAPGGPPDSVRTV
jgi:hypothetical protein